MCLSTSSAFVCCVKLFARTAFRASAAWSSLLNSLAQTRPHTQCPTTWYLLSFVVVIVRRRGRGRRRARALLEAALVLLRVGLRAPALLPHVADDELGGVDALLRAAQRADLDEVR
jgi:hypothetical protein